MFRGHVHSQIKHQAKQTGADASARKAGISIDETALRPYPLRDLLSAIVLARRAWTPRPGHAQIAPEGKGPVDITADQLTGHNKDCEAVYSGNAEALQGTSRLRANVMNFFNKKLPNPHPGGRRGRQSELR